MHSFALLAADYVGQSVLTGDIKTAVANGVADLMATVTDAVGITTPTIIAAIALTGGVAFVISKVRSVLSWAS